MHWVLHKHQAAVIITLFRMHSKNTTTNQMHAFACHIWPSTTTTCVYDVYDTSVCLFSVFVLLCIARFKWKTKNDVVISLLRSIAVFFYLPSWVCVYTMEIVVYSTEIHMERDFFYSLNVSIATDEFCGNDNCMKHNFQSKVNTLCSVDIWESFFITFPCFFITFL